MEMELLFWIIVFILSLVALVKGADWLLQSSEKIGLAVGLSPFIVGVLLVSLGTSFPELIASFLAASRGLTEFAAANAIGSNLANILLVVGFSALVAGRLTVTKNLIDVELPLLAIGTVLFLGVTWSGEVVFLEAILMLLVYGIYLLYTLKHKPEVVDEEVEVLPDRAERRQQSVAVDKRIKGVDLLWFVLGIILLALGAQYLIEAVVELADRLEAVEVGMITIVAVAIGTSLPELLVSIKAALNKNSEMALGNIFGSNAFNMLVVVGLPALFFGAELDEVTYTIGLPALAVVTLLFVVSGISRRIHVWEGAFFLALYVLFVSMLLGVS